MAEAFILLYLTFIFATFYGNNLINTLIFAAVLTTIVAFSRSSSIAALIILHEVFQLTVVECGNAAEERGFLRLLGAMPGVLVSKQGQKKRYTGGWCVDNHGEHLRTVRGVLFLLKLAITTVFFVVVSVVVCSIFKFVPMFGVIVVFGLTKWGMWPYLSDIFNSFWVDGQEQPRTGESEPELELGEVVAESYRI